MTELKLDYDYKSWFGYGPCVNLLKRIVFYEVVMRELLDVKAVFETKRGLHFYIETEKKKKEIEVILLQLFLGSDYKRELFNYRHVKNKVKKWNVLFIDREKERADLLTAMKILLWLYRLKDKIK